MRNSRPHFDVPLRINDTVVRARMTVASSSLRGLKIVSSHSIADARHLQSVPTYAPIHQARARVEQRDSPEASPLLVAEAAFSPSQPPEQRIVTSWLHPPWLI
jgi:hypothetical protein